MEMESTQEHRKFFHGCGHGFTEHAYTYYSVLGYCQMSLKHSTARSSRFRKQRCPPGPPTSKRKIPGCYSLRRFAQTRDGMYER